MFVANQQVGTTSKARREDPEISVQKFDFLLKLVLSPQRANKWTFFIVQETTIS